jgi:phage/plasmid-like protein (TIGR03299 family)
MAHEIDSMFYAGEKPWHGLGTKLAQVATAAEALAAAKLDWTVSRKELYLMDGTKVPDNFAIVRDDTNTPLGVVGNVYRPLQNKEAFSFFDAVVGEKLAIYHTAGSLRGGQYVWILAKLPGTIRITKDDVVEKFLLLTNAHNGTRAARMLFTPIRVVCMNTHNVALSLADADLRRAEAAGEEVTGQAWMRHTKNMGDKVAEVRKSLGIVSLQYRVYEETAKRMAATDLTVEAWKAYTQSVGLRPAKTADRDLPEATRKLLDEVTAMFDKGRGNDLPGVKHTAWGAFNAVAEYVDYSRSTDENDTRAKSILFGSGSRLKQKAWNEAAALSSFAGAVR